MQSVRGGASGWWWTWGCSVDGVKAPAAETEMSRKFLMGVRLSGNWELRQCFIMHPSGPADEEASRWLRGEVKGFSSRWGS